MMRRMQLTVFLLLAATFGVTARANTNSWFYSDIGRSAIVTPGHALRFHYFTYDSFDKEPVHVKLYRLSLEQTVSAMHSPYGEPDGGIIERGEYLRAVDSTPDRADADYYLSNAVDFDALPIGFYGLVATHGGSAHTGIVQVSTLGVVSNFTSRERLFWGVDLRSFERHGGPTSYRIVGEGSDKTYAADDDAVRIAPQAEKQRLLIASTGDGSRIVQSLESVSYGPQNNERGFIRTDRPIYRPGQMLHFSAVLRDGPIAELVPAHGERHVRVADSSGNAVFERTMKLDASGELHADVRLPDTPLGYYSVSVGAVETGISVEAYRKPEYELALSAPHDVVVGGDTTAVTVEGKYFFGRPAAGMHLSYSVYQNAEMRWYLGPYRFMNLPSWRGGGQYVVQGEATTDAAGRFVIPISTKRDDSYRTLSVSVDARDASGRTVSSSMQLSVVPAAFGIELHPQSWFGTANQPLRIDVSATSFDRKPRVQQPLDVQITRSRWDWKAQKEEVLERRTLAVRTNENGKSSLDWTPQHAGSYVVSVSGRDDAGRATSASLYLWIVGDNDDWTPPDQVAIVSEKDSVAPGERASILISVPKPGRDVLIAVGADHISSARVIHIAGRLARYSFDVPKNANAFSIYAQMPSETGVSNASLMLSVIPNPHALKVSVVPDRSRYEPGQHANLRLRVRDWRGHPVRAHVSLGLVDKSIYAMVPDGFDPLRFYNAALYLSPQYSWYKPNSAPPRPALKTIAHVTTRSAGFLVRPGSTADVYSAPSASAEQGAAAQERVRQNFADTAYWNPDVETNDDGRASVDFTFPDDLTTWVATGVASTTIDFGIERQPALVTKDFLVRLALPRFLRQHDRSTATGIAQGQATRRDVTLSLDGYTRERLQLDGNATARYAWDLSPGGDVGSMALLLRGNDSVLTDAMKLTLPIEPSGASEHVRDAGTLRATAALKMSLPPGYDSGDAKITITPSIVAQLVQNVRLLQVYPYYCTEQTMSAALPAIFVEGAARREDLTVPSDVKPDDIVKRAIRRLRELQHYDGSWGWWERDKAHPFMTAYALYGLTQMRDAGYAVPADMIERGEKSLIDQLQNSGDTLRLWGGAQPGSEWNTKAFMLFSLASADPAKMDRTALDGTYAHARNLNSYAVAVLGLALHRMNDDGRAREMLDVLKTRASQNDGYQYWLGQGWHYAWEDDPIETTAYALRLYAALAPDDPSVPRIVNFLRVEQRGNWWYTTKDTAAAIYALSEVERSEGGRPDGRVDIAVDGKVVATRAIQSAVLDRSDAEIAIPAKLLRDGTQITLARSGHGTVYWASDWTRYAPWTESSVRDRSRSLLARLFPAIPPLQVRRTYVTPHGSWNVGDEVTVKLDVTARDRTEYIAVEDPYPAGVEYSPEQGYGSVSWNGAQYFDDRAVFFVDSLYAGETLTLQYSFRVTTSGVYSAPPPVAYAMYGPPVSAVGRGLHVSVASR